MTSLRNTSLRLLVLNVLFLLSSTVQLSPQSTDGSMQMGTPERLEVEPWWPTKSAVAEAEFVGSPSCIGCHSDQAARPPTAMARAAMPANEATFLPQGPPATASLRPFTYAIFAKPGGIDYSVTEGTRKLEHSLDWVLGAGELGRTFLYQVDGRWYQSEVTLYTHAPSLDITTGLPSASGTGLLSALGQALSPSEARTCFACHTVHATTSAGFNPLHAEAGLGCEACHGPGRAHANANEPGKQPKDAHRDAGQGPPIFNPSRLSPVDSIDFCGACHRTFVDATLSTAHATSTAVVRFQPYRLEESKCWRATQDERLTCVACHDPHEQLSHNLATYDRHCLECHAMNANTRNANTRNAAHQGKACPQSTNGCVRCHMPKVEIASMHGTFTDHFIRVVRPGEGFPP